MKHRRSRQRGHVMLETALVFTAFSFLLLGIFDFGHFLFVHSTLADRARTAARWGAALDEIDVRAVRNFVLYGTPAERAGSVPQYQLAPQYVEVRIRDTGTEEARLEVRIVNYPYRVISPWISGTYTAQPIVAAVPLGPDR
ncbi:MAG: pilus assembly protein [Bryobacterales bacterium]|nr:pilus assembly protein [Bryobacterales bacterium]